jgi:hypothetical protein
LIFSKFIGHHPRDGLFALLVCFTTSKLYQYICETSEIFDGLSEFTTYQENFSEGFPHSKIAFSLG